MNLGLFLKVAADVLKKNMERATALLVGPGLGMEDTTKDFNSKHAYGEIGPREHEHPDRLFTKRIR